MCGADEFSCSAASMALESPLFKIILISKALISLSAGYAFFVHFLLAVGENHIRYGIAA